MMRRRELVIALEKEGIQCCFKDPLWRLRLLFRTLPIKTQEKYITIQQPPEEQKK